MLFDWFTVLAQIVNFLILMWLLKHFLYQPVLNAIDAREKRIVDLLSNTKQHQQQVQRQQDELSAKNSDFTNQREALLAKAKADAEQHKQALLVAAANEVELQRSKWLVSLKKDHDSLSHDIHQRTQHAVFDIVRKTLQDLSSTGLEENIIGVFVNQLAQLSEQQRLQFSDSAGGNVLIRSAEDLSDNSKNALKQAIDQTFSAASVSFEQDPTLISGIEMTGSGHKLSWNIDDYLSNLEDSIAKLVSSVALNEGSLSKGSLNNAETNKQVATDCSLKDSPSKDSLPQDQLPQDQSPQDQSPQDPSLKTPSSKAKGALSATNN